jgi:hypothetical protein
MMWLREASVNEGRMVVWFTKTRMDAERRVSQTPEPLKTAKPTNNIRNLTHGHKRCLQICQDFIR